MTKFVTVVLAVAVVVVGSASAIAGGWKTGNWEPSKKLAVKAVSLNADWGTAEVAPVASVAPAGCRGMVQHSHAAPAMRAGCNGGRGRFLGWPGWRIRANRQARAQASMASGHA